MMKKKRKKMTMDFESKKGNTYLYDAVTNMIFQNTNGFSDIVEFFYGTEKDKMISNLSGKYSEEGIKANYKYIDSLCKKFGAFYESDENISQNYFFQNEDEFKKDLCNINNIVLEVTQSCNLRCRYCIYSDDEGTSDFRIHTKKNMTFEIARKSLDHFFSIILSKNRVNKQKKIFINMYGGEPLLNFDLVKLVVAYAKEQTSKMSIKEKLYFAMTTNAMALKGEKLRFLVDNNFLLAISLDGPESEHDKNRITVTGKGSFSTVWRNIQELIDCNKDYFKSNVIFLPTISHNHDPFEFASFYDKFLKDRIDRLKVGLLRNDNIGNLNVAISKKFSQLKDAFHESLVEEKPLSIFMVSLLGPYYKMILQRNVLANRGRYTAACYPSSYRFFVSTTGEYHMCERINTNFSIGDYQTGIQFEKVRKIYEEYNETVVKKCKSCIAKNFCSVCFASAAKKDKFEVDKNCEQQIEITKKMLIDVVSLQEENHKVFKENLDMFIRKGILYEIAY